MEMHKASIAAIKRHLTTLNSDEKRALLPVLAADPRQGVQALAMQTERALAKEEAAKAQFLKLRQMEEEARTAGYRLICGTDEAGRGPLAGPVVAAAVILPPEAMLPGLDDSKRLGAKKREAMAEEIMQVATAYGIAEASVEEIEALNILHAAELAMERAIALCDPAPDLVLVDGTNRLKLDMPVRQVIGGDHLSASIAAASILAKVHRDRLMLAYDQKYPMYGFAGHKGYGSEAHYKAIAEYGPCPIHRRGFRLYS